MNIDTSTAKTAIFSSSEMAGAAAAIQTRNFSGSSTSFKEQMKTSETEEVQETEEIKETESSEKISETEKTEKTDDTEKTNKTNKTDKKETKKNKDKVSEKAQKEKVSNGNQTLTGEVTNSYDQNSQGQQNPHGQNAYSPLSDQVQAYMNANGVDFNFTTLNPMDASTRNQISGMHTTVDYTSIQMSDADAKFFTDLVSKTDMSMGSVASEFQKALQQGNVKNVQSSAKATAALIEALKESSKTNQPFRIDFDKDVSVILQVNKAGKINANFIPGDKAVENYLRNNIDSLRQRFDEENIAYGELEYSQSRRNKEQKKNNKENENE